MIRSGGAPKLIVGNDETNKKCITKGGEGEADHPSLPTSAEKVPKVVEKRPQLERPQVSQTPWMVHEAPRNQSAGRIYFERGTNKKPRRKARRGESPFFDSVC